MYFTRGPYGEKGKGRALFIIDPDGNETEINTRYLYGKPQEFNLIHLNLASYGHV